MDRCVACGAELGVGRFCLNCGHRIGTPAPQAAESVEPGEAVEVVEHQLVAPPVQAADPTPVAPTSPPDLSEESAVVAPAAGHEWDPREELLPYQEVDDLDQPAVGGRAWLWWVVGAVLLMGLVLVLLQVLET